VAEVWTEMAERCTQQPGAVAYARKYRNLANDASKLYADAKKEGDKADMKARQPYSKPVGFDLIGLANWIGLCKCEDYRVCGREGSS
jgi:hypothetical protein